MSEQNTKNMIDDYTLKITQKLSEEASLSQIFNFRAGQLITLYEKEKKSKIRTRTGDYSSTDNTVSSITSSMHVQNFDDVPRKETIIDAHQLLRALGGTPPPLEDCIRIVEKSRQKALPQSL